MPRRAIMSDGWAISSLLSKRIEPIRLSTMPMTDFSVVVLPAPLRPNSVTNSPLPISKSISCRMCDSPYQACRPATFKSGSPAFISGPPAFTCGSAMTGTDIGLDDEGIGGHCGVGSLRQDLAARQHRDRVRQVGNHRHIVLDHQHGAIARQLADQRGDAFDVFLTET